MKRRRLFAGLLAAPALIVVPTRAKASTEAERAEALRLLRRRSDSMFVYQVDGIKRGTSQYGETFLAFHHIVDDGPDAPLQCVGAVNSWMATTLEGNHTVWPNPGAIVWRRRPYFTESEGKLKISARAHSIVNSLPVNGGVEVVLGAVWQDNVVWDRVGDKEHGLLFRWRGDIRGCVGTYGGWEWRESDRLQRHVLFDADACLPFAVKRLTESYKAREKNRQEYVAWKSGIESRYRSRA